MDWFPSTLADHGARPALLTGEGTISYAELADRVGTAADRLGRRRRLVLLAGANHPDAVVLYLAAIVGRHPLILVGADNRDALRRLVDTYDPDVVAGPSDHDDGGWEIHERTQRSRHEPHPDLALLLSTSGSTGSPKLVRLSHANLQANAESIASFLAITDADRAVTSLPMAYCYGLSVINSHLHRGASVVLTERSVIEPEFWELLRRAQATSFAGVPYTFDLLDRVGFADMALPHLRYITQAGGRLDPRRVREYAELGRRNGWELFVMYGQTEATARMTYLPPALAATRPESIGVPIPGGSLRLDPAPDAAGEAGELVYRGPNVMLGYAEGPSDLGLGPTIDELRTGDLGRRGPDGLYEIVGRRGQFLKIAGLRIDPLAVELLAERHGAVACAVGTDEQLVVFAEPDAPADLHTLIRDTIGVPGHALRVITRPTLPRLPNGKLDRTAMQELAASDGQATVTTGTRDAATALRDLYASALGRAEVTDGDSFSSLGGDSLSYVEITLGLEEILGRLPDGWSSMSLRELAALAPTAVPEPSPWSRLLRWRSVEISVALRAVAIVLIVASHIGMATAYGGAHVLMAVAGFNFARFRLTAATRSERVWSQLRAVARIAIPAMVWVALVMLLLDQYELRHLLLINAIVRDELWGNLWFIELLVYIGLAMAAAFAVPAFDRAERRSPFGVAIAVLGVGLLFRFEALDFGIPYTKPVLWLFAIGWAASRARRHWQRGLVLAITLASVPGYFDSWERNAIILLGLLLLVGVPRIAVPGALARIGGVLAGASLYIYLVHWEVWPMFDGWYGLPSLVASLVAGTALWLVASRAATFMSGIRGWGRAWNPIGSALFGRVPGGPAAMKARRSPDRSIP
jgi:acyl-CoA synthetase (AMP-forming)/AMP-acid ligase II